MRNMTLYVNRAGFFLARLFMVMHTEPGPKCSATPKRKRNMHYRYVPGSNESMDRTLAALAQADQHVAESRQRIAKQQALVNQLERDGHDSTMAKALLQEFRHSLQLHLIGRATIEADVARARSDALAAAATPGHARDGLPGDQLIKPRRELS